MSQFLSLAALSLIYDEQLVQLVFFFFFDYFFFCAVLWHANWLGVVPEAVTMVWNALLKCFFYIKHTARLTRARYLLTQIKLCRSREST